MTDLPTPAADRPSPFGGGLTSRRVGRIEWHVRPDLADELIADQGPPVERWLEAGVAEIVKHGGHRTVYRVSLPAGVFYLKHYRLCGPRAWLQNNLRPCRAYREAAASALVREAGIPTAEPVAVGRRTFGPFSGESWFATREIAGVRPLDEILASRSGTDRDAIADTLARLTATLHRRGLFHADYHAGNVLASPDDPTGRLWLIDLHPLRAARVTRRRRRSMLGIFASGFDSASPAARRRFLTAYAEAAGGVDVDDLDGLLVGEIADRFRRADQKWRRGNRRLLILDSGSVACRGLSELGRDTLVSWREALTANPAAELETTDGAILVRRLPPGSGGAETPARRAWEIGHALARREFPVAKPLLFVASRAGGAVVERTSPTVAPDSPARLLRRLHDAGLDAPPAAFDDGRPFIARPEEVAPRRMTAGRRRSAVAGFAAALPPSKRDEFLRAYAGDDERLQALLGVRNEDGSSGGTIGRRRAIAALLAGVVAPSLLAGCKTIEPKPLATLPAKHSVRADHLVVVSDFKLSTNHPLFVDLIDLRKKVEKTLQLPEPRRDVVVYLFGGEEPYRKYLETTHPGLPPRRAYFVGTKSELAVYTYWGDRVQEDLRHEYTHGLLHASLDHVPLWLDEGLAEYFEVPGAEPGGMNGDYPQQLAGAVGRGWRPDIARLEAIEEFSQLRRIDYQESWAWVHYLLNETPDTRETLLSYLADLRDPGPTPSPLSERLAALGPGYGDRFLGYVASLNATGGAVIRAAGPEPDGYGRRAGVARLESF